MWFLDKDKNQSGKKQILVADDDPGERMLLQEFFEMVGYEVLQVSDGESAIKIAAKYLPCLITMDMSMPGMPGSEAVRVIRSNPKTKQIPVLMCTGNNRVQDIDECLAAGANDYIPKPIDLARLKAKCVKLLGPSAPA